METKFPRTQRGLFTHTLSSKELSRVTWGVSTGIESPIPSGRESIFFGKLKYRVFIIDRYWPSLMVLRNIWCALFSAFDDSPVRVKAVQLPKTLHGVYFAEDIYMHLYPKNDERDDCIQERSYIMNWLNILILFTRLYSFFNFFYLFIYLFLMRPLYLRYNDFKIFR